MTDQAASGVRTSAAAGAARRSPNSASMSRHHGVFLLRTRPPVVRGTAPRECARNAPRGSAVARYRPAREGPRGRPAPDFINARASGDTQLMWLRSRSTSSSADDAHHPLRSRGVGVAHGRSEEDPRRRPPRSRGFRVHDFRGIDSLREKANPPIDLAQPPLAVLIVGVFAAIAVARRPRHHLRHRRPFPGEQKPVLVLEPLQAARRDVVLDSHGRRIGLRCPCRCRPPHAAASIQSRLRGHDGNFLESLSGTIPRGLHQCDFFSDTPVEAPGGPTPR